MTPTTLFLRALLGVHHRAAPVSARRRSERGQATAEYALVLLGAAAIALLLAAWAAKSGAISRLFDAVVEQLIGEVG
jgi:Flp pilus assembly pilin Flp